MSGPCMTAIPAATSRASMPFRLPAIWWWIRAQPASACRLRPKQCEINDVNPAQNAVDDRPEDGTVVGVGDRHRQCGAETHAVFGAFKSDCVGTVAVHVITS